MVESVLTYSYVDRAETLVRILHPWISLARFHRCPLQPGPSHADVIPLDQSGDVGKAELEVRMPLEYRASETLRYNEHRYWIWTTEKWTHPTLCIKMPNIMNNQPVFCSNCSHHVPAIHRTHLSGQPRPDRIRYRSPGICFILRIFIFLTCKYIL